MVISDNVTIVNIPPYPPEMHPITQAQRELWTKGFKKEVSQTQKKIVDRLCRTINNLTSETISRITSRDWILSIFIREKSIQNNKKTERIFNKEEKVRIYTVWWLRLDSNQ